MIFQHTIGYVLSGKKTATTRIWKENYFAVLDAINKSDDARYSQLYYVGSRKTQKKLYYVGQKHSVQPGRGQRGIATIEIIGLSKIMIYRAIDDPDFIYREGFENKAEFLKVWRAMHGSDQLALHIRFKCIKLN